MDFTVTAQDIDNATGTAAFDGVGASPVPAPSSLYLAVARLVGSNQAPCSVAVEWNSLLDDGGNQVLVPETVLPDLRRGDARADRTINIADATYIAQNLAGWRHTCTSTVDASCLHSLNAASVRPDAAFDRSNISDARAIAQYLLGLAGEFYNPVP